jgi:GrpB-like predicted nucleotidyltransferase (UPF0157 family)
MALTSKIAPYDSRWPARFFVEKERVAKSFGTELGDIHHVGSTAVPGLPAKPEIDLLVEVSEHRNQAARDASMRALGYVRGKDLSAGHHFYRRDVDGVRTHKVHVCVSGHWQIDECSAFVTSCEMIRCPTAISGFETSARSEQSTGHWRVSCAEGSLY